MTTQLVTLNLPELHYSRLQSMVQSIRQSLETVLLQTLSKHLPPKLDDLPVALQEEVASWALLSDESLWRIAQEVLPSQHLPANTCPANTCVDNDFCLTKIVPERLPLRSA